MDEVEAEGGTAFPRVVTWGSLVLALGLFFGATVPALRERDQLRRVEVETEELRDSYHTALQEAATTGRGGLGHQPQDLQALLVAIDRLGLVPAELLQMYPLQPGIEPERR